jgi:hypothetical protein
VLVQIPQRADVVLVNEVCQLCSADLASAPLVKLEGQFLQFQAYLGLVCLAGQGPELAFDLLWQCIHCLASGFGPLRTAWAER